MVAIPISCQNRLQKIGAFPTHPGIKILLKDSLYTSLVDSIKLSNPNYSYYGLDIRLSDSDSYYNSLTYSITMGKGYIISRNDTLQGDLPFTGLRSQTTFEPNGEGLVQMTFSAQDQLNRVSNAYFQVLVFKNLPPITSFTVSPVQVLDSLEYLIDASQSYDEDRDFGGGIVQYTYVIENDTIETSLNQIKHIFSMPGIFTIAVRTKDNEGAYSAWNIQQRNITK